VAHAVCPRKKSEKHKKTAGVWHQRFLKKKELVEFMRLKASHTAGAEIQK